MAVNLEAILGMRNLCGMIQSVVGRCPEDILPPEMYKVTRSIEGNRGTYFKVRGTRQTARIVQYGSPSKARELPGVSEEPLTLLHSFEHCIHPAALLSNLAAEHQDNPDAEIKQRLGLQTVTRQIEVFGDLFKNLRVSCIYSALANGVIYWDAGGNLLPSSTGAVYTVNFGIPNQPLNYSATSQYTVGSYTTYQGAVYKCTTAIATGGEAWTAGHWSAVSGGVGSNGLPLTGSVAGAPNSAYCNYGTLASIIGGVAGMSAVDTTLWSNSAALIQEQMIALKQVARARTGYPLECAFYGSAILPWINANAIVKQVLTGSARYAEAAMITEIPDGTFGIKKWYPVSEAFFAQYVPGTPLGADESANVNFWFPPNQITFTPAPNPEWWEPTEGTFPVPAAFNITKDMMGQLTALKQVAGPFSYATLMDDPPSVKHLAGTTELPVIKVPGAVFQVLVG